MMISEWQLKRFEEMFRTDHNYTEYEMVLVCIGHGLVFSEIRNELEKAGICHELVWGKCQVEQNKCGYFESETVNLDYIYVLYEQMDRAIEIIKDMGMTGILFKGDTQRIRSNELGDGIYEL